MLTEQEYYGALRNLVLVRTILPSHWSVRIYLPLCTNTNLVKRLQDFGATIIFVTSNELVSKCVKSLPINESVIHITDNATPTYWPYFVLRDATVDYVLVRNATHRITTHEARLVMEWELSNKTVHVISYLSKNNNYCLIGGKRTTLDRLSWQTTLQTMSYSCKILKSLAQNGENVLVHNVFFSNTASINIGEVVGVNEVPLFRDLLNKTEFKQQFHEDTMAKKVQEENKIKRKFDRSWQLENYH